MECIMDYSRLVTESTMSITERGDIVRASLRILGDVLWSQNTGNASVFRKWIFDVLKGVETAYEVHNN